MVRALSIAWLAAQPIKSAAAAPTSDRPAASPTIATTSETKPELERDFDGQPGTFVLYDLKRDHILRHNPDRAAQHFLPAATFKVLNSLITLGTGVGSDENTAIKMAMSTSLPRIWNCPLMPLTIHAPEKRPGAFYETWS